MVRRKQKAVPWSSPQRKAMIPLSIRQWKAAGICLTAEQMSATLAMAEKLGLALDGIKDYEVLADALQDEGAGWARCRKVLAIGWQRCVWCLGSACGWWPELHGTHSQLKDAATANRAHLLLAMLQSIAAQVVRVCVEGHQPTHHWQCQVRPIMVHSMLRTTEDMRRWLDRMVERGLVEVGTDDDLVVEKGRRRHD